MMKHEALVVPVVLEPHPNADKLSIVRVGDYTVVANTESWTGKSKGVYITPDTIVDPARPEFSFLDKGRGSERVKVCKLRGIYSQGLLIPTERDLGEDLYNELGLRHYEPELDSSMTTDNIPAPPGHEGLSKYDIENGRKYLRKYFTEGEPVYITEKLHGHNQLITGAGSEVFVRSRSNWKLQDPKCLFWQCYEPVKDAVNKFLSVYPNHRVWGEGYGKVKGFKYDTTRPSFRAFDIQQPNGEYCCVERFLDLTQEFSIPTVPVLKVNYPLNYDEVFTLAEGDSLLGGNIREGVVVKPMVERREKIGRVFVKVVSNKFLEK